MAGALRKIEDELIALAEAADEEHPIDPHAIRIIARKVNAQAEMQEHGLNGGAE